MTQKTNYPGDEYIKTIRSIVARAGFAPSRSPEITTIYKTSIKEPICIYPHELSGGLIIHAAWQEVRGSADLKYPYLVKNIKELYPFPTVIVLGGKGMQIGAVWWLKNQVDKKKLLGVFEGTDEFFSWMRGLKPVEVLETMEAKT